MSNQVEPGIFGGAGPDQGGFSSAMQEGEQGRLAYEPADWQPPRAFHGRPVSWAAVSIIVIGFLIGGVALVLGPTWWLFWVSLAITVVGGLLALATNIFEDWY